ncbi:MAG: hypothetical protein ACLRRJ_01805 [Clostridium sp.]
MPGTTSRAAACVVNSWAQIKDNWYLFGTDGKMMTGWAKLTPTTII